MTLIPHWLRAVVALVILSAGFIIGMLVAQAQFGQASEPEKKADATELNTTYTVMAAGDIACEPGAPVTSVTCQHAATAQLVAGVQPTAVLALGDLQYEDGTLEKFKTSYDKTWGAFKTITRPVPGNHEYTTPGAAGYYDYFGEQAGTSKRGYYSYTIGKWHMIALNSEVDMAAGSPQMEWLKGDLANSSQNYLCTLAYWHKPRFSSGSHGNNNQADAVWRELHNAGVDVVLGGHSHSYERFVPLGADGQPDDQRGITQFVSGMGGKSSQPMLSPSPHAVVRQNYTFGVLRLDLTEGELRYEFMGIPGVQQFRDVGRVACHS